MLDATTKRQIQECDPFMLILPDGNFESTEGAQHLDYAISLGKHILVWRKPERQHQALPLALNHYADHMVVDGDVEAVYRAVEQYWELAPGDEVIITSRGYET